MKDLEANHQTTVSEELWTVRFRQCCSDCCVKTWPVLRVIILVLLLCGYFVYFAFAIRYNFEYAKALVVITPLVAALILYVIIRDRFGYQINNAVCRPAGAWMDRNQYWLKCLLAVAVVLAIVLYLTLVVVRTARQLQSLAGMVFCFVIPWLTSKHPQQIQWRPVIWGFALQFLIGVVVLRWQAGYDAVNWVSNEINKFIFYALDGAAAVFGDPFFLLHPFLMIVVPLVVHLGAVMAVFYYLGITQIIAAKMGWLMSITMKTTAIESIGLAANIFLSVLDTILMLKPYLGMLTMSELHCFLVGAHSTIAGFAFGLFVLFGVSAQHLLTGAVMSAPAAVALAKLNYPETQQSRFKNHKNFKLDRGRERNLAEAFANGAMAAARGVIIILLQVVAFVSLYVFLDTTVAWLGERVGITITIDIILGYIFMPIAFILGIDWADTKQVGQLLGLKVAMNEFLGYIELGWLNINNAIDPRSNAIATYAMCGFSSIGTLAIFSSVWVTVNPERWSQVTSLIPRIFINANLSCFMTACVAGLFYSDGIVREPDRNPAASLIINLLGSLPTFRDLTGLLS